MTRKLFGRARTVGLTVGAVAYGGGLAAARLGYAGLLEPICGLAGLGAHAAFSQPKCEPAAEAGLSH